MVAVQVISAGLGRRAWLFVPPGCRGRLHLPLLLAMHGGGGRADRMNKLTGFNRLAEREGFVVCYPEGVDKQWNDGRSNLKWRIHDDVTFIEQLIDVLANDLNLDRKRVYASGISNGGFFSQYMVLKMRQRRIAAVASVAATLPVEVAAHYLPPSAVPIMYMLGTDDPLVPFQGGELTIGRLKRGQVLSARQCVEYWVAANHADKVPEHSEIEHRDSADGTHVLVDRYRASAPGAADVLSYTVQGGGHTWPGGWQYLPERLIGRTSRAVDASEAIWSFFKEQSL